MFVSELLGGALIGLACTAHLMFSGRITGISGIIKDVMQKQSSWALALVVGMLITASFLPAPPDPKISGFHTAFAGLLVGIGSQMANGCTSGHGVCGLARRSKRSMVAVGTFMITALSMCNRKIPELPALDKFLAGAPGIPFKGVLGFVLILVILIALNEFVWKRSREGMANLITAMTTGSVFALGLSISGLNNPHRIRASLNWCAGFHSWDSVLLFGFAGSILVTGFLFPIILQRQHPAFHAHFEIPTDQDIDPRLIIGSALFGLGWSIAGVCPGPGIFGLASGNGFFSLWMTSYILGLHLYHSTISPRIEQHIESSKKPILIR
jgi:uncharacterized membrane protein YedE/YeeE